MWFTSHLLRDHQFWYRTQYLHLLLWTPSTPYFRHQTIACPLETSHDTSLLCSWYFLKFEFESYFRHLPQCYRLDSRPCRGPFLPECPPLILFRKYDKDPEERMATSSWLRKAEKWIHQRKGSTSLKGQLRPRRLVRFFATNTFPPLTPPLKSRDEISCSGGELWRPDN